MTVKLLNEQHLEFLSLKGVCRDSSESTLGKMSNCLKSHAAAHIQPTECTCSYMHTYQVIYELFTAHNCWHSNIYEQDKFHAQ